MKRFAFSMILSLVSFSAHAEWNTILRCENGLVWVDVDSNARTNLQLVSRDSGTNLYFNQTLQAEAPFEGGTSGSWETVWRGTQPAGVFTASDFQGATQTYHRIPLESPTLIQGQYLMSYDEYASFYRVGDHSLKLQITRSNIQRCTNNQYNGRYGKCTSGTEKIPDQYVGDHVFNNCQ